VKRLLYLICMTIIVTMTFSQVAGAGNNQDDVYKVGINDVIGIEVLGHNLRVVNAVSSDGTITFPYLGNVYVQDMSLAEIEKEITKRLSDGYIKYPEVLVTIVTSKSKKIYTYGEIRNLGVIPFEENMTLVKAMSYVGGVSSDGLYGRIKVRREQEGEHGGYKDIAESKLNDGVIESKKVEDMLLRPDDILIVERNKKFLIEGEVSKRGRFVLERDMTVLRALLQGGGVTSDGLYGMIKIRRKQAGEYVGYKDIAESKLNDGVIESREVEDMLIQPDDILIVERNKTFFIYGEVHNTGEFVLQSDMTVFKAITIAGGFTKWGSGNRVNVLRQSENRNGFETVKVNIDDVIDGDATADIELKPGDMIIVSSGIF